MKAGTLWGIILGALLWVPVLGAQKVAAPPAAAPPSAAPPAAAKPGPASKVSSSPQAAKGAARPTSAAAPGGTSKVSSPPQAAKAPATPAPSGNRGKRRDPFNSLIPTKLPPVGGAVPPRLPPGKRGLVIEQLQLQGIVHGIDGAWIAVVDNKTKRAYFLHEKDQLYNGVVSKITADSVVFLEGSTDALGNAVSREVVKRLAAQ